MRVYSQYAILASERDAEGLEGHMNYYVRLYNIAKVLTKSPVKESFILADETNRQDSIGNDPINLSEAWFGGKYLNVEFTMPVKNNSGVKHFINIVEDDVTVHNDTVYLTLRHNAYGDKPEAGNRKEDSAYRWVWGNASFDLTSILPEGATSVPVKLVWTAYKKDSSETEQLSDSGLYTLLPQSKASVSGGLNAKNVSGKKGQGNARVERMICR